LLARNDGSGVGGFIHISVIARPVGFRPKRSPNVDQGLYCGWRLLRSGAALPSTTLHRSREEAHWNYSSSSLAMTGLGMGALFISLSSRGLWSSGRSDPPT